ncbi:MAG: DUF192 domain-containing protein [Candidatus Aenigmatarchaeota archaeon]
MREFIVKFHKKRIKVKVRKNFLERSVGLMFKRKLKENEGMLFVFEKECFPSFWTFGMFFPIDIIWLDEEMKVVDLSECLKPFRVWKFYRPRRASKFVLEVNSGFVKKNGIKLGDKFVLERK